MRKGWKRLLVIFFVLFIVVPRERCGNLYTVKQTQKHFEWLKPVIVNIVSKYDEEILITEVRNNSSSQSLFISTSDHATIEVRIYNGSGLSSQKNSLMRRIEYYYIKYENDYSKTSQEINVNLFTDLVNSVSKKWISRDSVEDFLSSPPEKYPASRFGAENPTGDKGKPVIKARSYDLLEEEYILWYELRYKQDGPVEYLSMSGYTIF